VSVLIFQCVLVVMCINYQQHVQLQSELLLVFTLLSVLNGWDRMRVHNDMHVVAFPCMKSTTPLTMSTLCQLLGWIYNLYGRSFICLCMLRPLLYLFLLQLILLSMPLMLFLELLLEHMQLLLYSILCLLVLFMSHRHLIARVSKVAFTISGFAWACNFVPPLCCQQPSSCVHCIRYVAFSCCSWCCLLWCCFRHTLMSFSTNNLMCLWVSKFIDTWSTTSPSVLWTVSSTPLSWKWFYLYCWEADEHPRYLETWQHSRQEICRLKTKMNLRTDLQHTCVTNHEGCAISTERSGDWLLRLRKAQSGLSGGWMTTGTAQCTVQPSCWLLELCNAQSQLAMLAGSMAALRNFLGQ